MFDSQMVLHSSMYIAADNCSCIFIMFISYISFVSPLNIALGLDVKILGFDTNSLYPKSYGKKVRIYAMNSIYR